jgi:hypothetical protein
MLYNRLNAVVGEHSGRWKTPPTTIPIGKDEMSLTTADQY